ncbi:ATP-binding protein [Fundidesulfovibrio agrisoli]|uniref:ATP-binding protein n=1 Tax=Fundidesulfovibrio agrisoli TaxID=2922717 RepID=UPI001FABD5C7|nr:ATP-binding protein [Fundidesulfovibrio agrisoli]
MDTNRTEPLRNLLLAVLLPFLAFAVQLAFWQYIDPFVWFLFFPAVFFSARIGGLHGGLASTLISAVIVWYAFMPTRFSWTITSPGNFYSVLLFLVMGALFSDSQERLRRARLQAEDSLRESLEAKNQITALYEKTRELDRLKTNFFANVSHELRTPLALILGPTEQSLASGSLDDRTRHNLEVIRRNASLLQRHVTDLLDVAKLEAKRMAMRYSRFDLAYLTRVMCSHFESLASVRGVAFHIETPAHLPCEMDSDKVQRILLNLLSNAFKFTPDGGEIRVSLTVEAGRAALTVRDNGPGIPEHMLQAVFERFRQVDDGATRKHGGTGLGLVIVKEFAELHGGRVHAANAPGGGAAFMLEMPLTAPAGTIFDADPQNIDEDMFRLNWGGFTPEPIPPAQDACPADPHAPVVLVVEDNPDMNRFITSALERRYRVVNAFDGEEGLAKALELQPDIVLADVMIPKMSGDEMALALRRRPETADTPIVMLTAKADEALREKMLRSGVQDYIAKPFSVAELQARVALLVSGRLKIQEEQARLAAIVESTDEAIIGKSLDGVILTWNSGAEKIFGHPAREILGRSALRLFPPELAATEADIMARARTGEAIPPFDTVRLRKDGSPVDVSVSVSPIMDRQGNVTGISTIARDITARKRAEAELIEMKDRAEAASKAKSEFLANMSHEIRTPLNGIIGMLQLMDMGELDPQQREYHQAATKASLRLASLLTDILDLSRIEAHKLAIRVTEFKTSLIGDTLLELFGVAAREKNLALEIRLDERLPRTLVGDENRLLQILFNLVGNAIKFTSKGRVLVEASPLPSGPGGEPRVLFTVSDTGIGIPDAELEHILEPFTQAEASYSRSFQGAGLGLTIARKLTGLLKGEMCIDNSGPEGTSITLSLPFGLPSGATPGPMAQARPNAPAGGRPLRILLAEDDAVNAMAGRRILEKCGHQVRRAADGAQALDLFREQDFDLILMDVQMPVMDGLEATRAIRADTSLGAKALVPIVAMTAYAMQGDREKCLEAGMNGYISKPVEKEVLLAAIREATGA